MWLQPAARFGNIWLSCLTFCYPHRNAILRCLCNIRCIKLLFFFQPNHSVTNVTKTFDIDGKGSSCSALAVTFGNKNENSFLLKFAKEKNTSFHLSTVFATVNGGMCFIMSVKRLWQFNLIFSNYDKQQLDAYWKENYTIKGKKQLRNALLVFDIEGNVLGSFQAFGFSTYLSCTGFIASTSLWLLHPLFCVVLLLITKQLETGN